MANDLTKPSGGLITPGQAPNTQVASVAANHAAAVALIDRLLTLPVTRYRDHELVLQRIRFEAEVEGKSHFYSFPVKNRRTGKTSEIAGPSIGLAESVLMAVGNCAVIPTHHETPEAWVFTSTFIDRETGSILTRQFRQRRSQQTFKTDDAERQEDIAFQIGQSKANRNVIVRGLASFCDYAFQYARRQLLVKIEQDPAKWRERIIERLRSEGIGADRVSAWVGRGSNVWEADDLVKIAAALQAIGERLTTAQDVWPAPEQTDAPKAPPREAAQPSGTRPRDDGAPQTEGPPIDDAPAGEDDGWPEPKS